ncbi:hypothetical protein BZG36_05051 [Bifiguratus adelaidae]|uniref:Mid2 domain-containing protein n=1 Tax=Bifiguratus adelaidae TaxID=1938954 RepID=A0A261XYX7_9FUNG|nr:hypothetical protein BZG36_05051 [Bifiguratus adelaidae]
MARAIAVSPAETRAQSAAVIQPSKTPSPSTLTLKLEIEKNASSVSLTLSQAKGTVIPPHYQHLKVRQDAGNSTTPTNPSTPSSQPGGSSSPPPPPPPPSTSSSTSSSSSSQSSNTPSSTTSNSHSTAPVSSSKASTSFSMKTIAITSNGSTFLTTSVTPVSTTTVGGTSSTNTNLAVIIGPVVGGAVFLIIIGTWALFYRRRKQRARWDKNTALFKDEHDHNVFPELHAVSPIPDRYETRPRSRLTAVPVPITQERRDPPVKNPYYEQDPKWSYALPEPYNYHEPYASSNQTFQKLNEQERKPDSRE